jgi:tetratricopeptide (TPR) repeat protein
VKQSNAHERSKWQRWALILAILLPGCGWNPLGSKEDYLRRGREFARQGKNDDAAFQYRKALQKDNNFGQVYLFYGQLLYRQNKYADAIASFARAVQLMPTSSLAKVELGRAAVSELLKNPRRPPALRQAAGKMAAELLAADPHSFEGLRLMGYLAVADSRPKEAIDYFRKTLAANPNLPEILTVLTQTLVFDNQGGEAENVAKSALANFQHYGPLYDALYSYYLTSHRPSDGEQILRSKIANNPKVILFVIELADHHWRQDNLPEMEKVLHELAANSATYPDAALQVGDFYRRIGSLDEAVRAYQAASDSGRNKDSLERIVGVRIAQGHTEEAATLLQGILKQYPDDAIALASRADLRMATGNLDEMHKAAGELGALAKKEPDNTEIRYSLGRVYRQLGRDEDAQSAFREILQHDPKHPGALRELADLAIRNQRADDALRYAERLLQIDPNNTGARLVRTSAWALNGRYAEVRAELRRILARNPDLTEVSLQMATLGLETRNYAESEQIFRRLYQSKKDDVRPARGLVALYMVQREPQKALTIAREEAGRSRNPQARELLASTAAQAGNLNLALSTAEGLSADFPRDPDHWIFVGEIYQRKGQLDQAISSFRTAQTVAPGNAIAPSRLSAALAQANRLDEAMEICRHTLKIRPDDPIVMNSLAWYSALAGKNLEEAAGYSQRAVHLDPRNSAFADTAGMVYLKSGKLDEALQTFQRLVRQESNNVTFRTHLATVLIQRGERQKARKELETALETNPSEEQSVEIRKLLKSVS